MQKQHKVLRRVAHLVRRLFGAPFQDLPPAFGNTVPPEMRVFEAELDEMEHHAVGRAGAPGEHGHRPGKPAR